MALLSATGPQLTALWSNADGSRQRLMDAIARLESLQFLHLKHGEFEDVTADFSRLRVRAVFGQQMRVCHGCKPLATSANTLNHMAVRHGMIRMQRLVQTAAGVTCNRFHMLCTTASIVSASRTVLQELGQLHL